jgi:hypothetical protein
LVLAPTIFSVGSGDRGRDEIDRVIVADIDADALVIKRAHRSCGGGSTAWLRKNTQRSPKNVMLYSVTFPGGNGTQFTFRKLDESALQWSVRIA